MIIKEVPCPKCHEEELTYNGNYYCTNCDWAMDHEDEAETIYDRVIKRAYMTQVRDSTNDSWIKARMNYYLTRMDVD